MSYRFLFRILSVNDRQNLYEFRRFPSLTRIENEFRRWKSSDVTGVSFTPLPDAELKIQLYYKSQEIKRRKEKLKEIAKSIWKNKPNVDFTRITFDQSKKMYEENTGRVPSTWEAQQIYSVTLEEYAPWRHFQEEKERQQRVRVMIEQIYDELQNQVKQGEDLTLSKSDMTVLLEKKLGELPSSEHVEDMWMDRFRLPLFKWLE